jgi:hypothetical protein
LVITVVGLLGALAPAAAQASITPGWECIPSTAGQAVVSGGTAASPSCGADNTAVLAPTYISSGVGGKPTVEFALVNVQIVNGDGSTASADGKGNLVIGYDESPGSQTGSHDLVLGQHQSYTSYGGLVGGFGNQVSGHYAAALGEANRASGTEAVAAGDGNTASGIATSALGGFNNVVSSQFSALLGGCSNRVGTGTVSVNKACTDTSGHAGDYASISGGAGNQATGLDTAVGGGENRSVASPGNTVIGPSAWGP